MNLVFGVVSAGRQMSSKRMPRNLILVQRLRSEKGVRVRNDHPFPVRSLSLLMKCFCLATAQISRGDSGADFTGKDMSYLENGKVKVGVDLRMGGAITYLSHSPSGENMINSYDHGRQIQMSHYSGPIPFAPNGKQPVENAAGLGWNPIQAGDCWGNPSKIVAFKNDGKSIYVRCIPMQWPLKNEPGECEFECWITLRENMVQVRSRLTNHRADKTQYTARSQELPAIYTNGPWYRLMTYVGSDPFSGGELTQIPPVMPWRAFQGTENWAALVDKNDDGVGIWEPGVTTFLGGFAGTPGSGRPTEGPTGYLTPLRDEIIDHNIVYDFNYVLILGKLKDIRKTVYQFPREPKAPTYRFARDRQHWHYWRTFDAGWPIKNELKVSLDSDDPQMYGPSGIWKAADIPKMTVTAAYTSTETEGRVFWNVFGSNEFIGKRSIAFRVIPDGKFHTYTVNLASSPEFSGVITGIRLDPVARGGPGETVRIQSIRLHR